MNICQYNDFFKVETALEYEKFGIETETMIEREKEERRRWYQNIFPRKTYTMLKDNLSWVTIITMLLEKQEKEGNNNFNCKLLYKSSIHF